MNKSLSQWLLEYGASHQNPTNKSIHWFCVPLIFWVCVGLLSVLSETLALPTWGIPLAVLFAVTVYYWILLPALAISMLGFSLLCLGSHIWLNEWVGLTSYCIGLLVAFAILWIMQFVGHKIEGKKPSFFQDLQFLLIGPAWVIVDISKKLR